VAVVTVAMDTFAPSSTDRALPKLTALACMPPAEFVARWRALTGEPPAVMLDNRSEMLALLVESVPAAPLMLPRAVEPADDSPCRTRSGACAPRSLPSNVLTFRSRDGRPSPLAHGIDRAAG
jgi:hypothetical protein